MTAPITPDERAAMRALADAATPGPWEAHEGTVGAMTGPRGCGGCSGLVSPRHEPACFWSEVAGAAPADAAFIAAARTAVPRLLNALDTAEAETVRLRAERRCSDMEAYAETWNAGYENAMAQELADNPTLADDWLVEHDERVRRAAEAERDQARTELAVARQHQREASLTIRSVEGLRKERDDALAKIDRQADRLRVREEQVRRLRAEVTRLHALVATERAARSAPVWDEDTVTEAVRRSLESLWGAPEGAPRVYRSEAVAVLAAVREHLPVRPDREALRRFVDSFCDDEAGEVEHVVSADGTSGFALTGGNDAHAVLRKAASALWPGESRADRLDPKEK